MNVYPGLGALHTIFMRYHNYIAEELAATYSDDDEIFYLARKIVIAVLQKITYKGRTGLIMTVSVRFSLLFVHCPYLPSSHVFMSINFVYVTCYHPISCYIYFHTIIKFICIFYNIIIISFWDVSFYCRKRPPARVFQLSLSFIAFVSSVYTFYNSIIIDRSVLASLLWIFFFTSPFYFSFLSTARSFFSKTFFF